MCVFCEIMSSRPERNGSGKRTLELPWAGRTPIDEYRLASEWRERNAGSLELFRRECYGLSLGRGKGAVKHRPAKVRLYGDKAAERVNSRRTGDNRI